MKTEQENKIEGTEANTDASATKTDENVASETVTTTTEEPVATAEGQPSEVAANAEPTEKTEGEPTPPEGEATKEGEAKVEEPVVEESSEESESDSDFDIMEEIDPSYEIDSSMWKKVKDFDECDLKPEKKDDPEKGDKPEKRKKEEVEEEEEDGERELFHIRTEKERDEEFRNYVRDLCRPRIVSFLPDRNAPKGSNVKLTCTVEGNNITVKWLKNGNELQRGKTVQTRSDGEIHILEITKITSKDAGEYTVVFKNRAGEVSTSSLIKVFDGRLHKPDHLDIALVKDYYDYALGGLVIEAHVHGLPQPTVKFYKDHHLLHQKRGKVHLFVENKEIYQCLIVRADASATGMYTVLAENKTGKKRFEHFVDFKTRYPLIHLPGMHHADKKNFVEEILEMLPKPKEEQKEGAPAEPEPPKQDAEKGALDAEQKEGGVKPEELTKALEEGVEPPAAPQELVEVTIEEAPKPEEKKKEKKKKKRSRKKSLTPETDDDLIDDPSEEEPEEFDLTGVSTPAEGFHPTIRRPVEVERTPYQEESIRIKNSKNNLTFSGRLKDQTAIEGKTVKLLCTVSGPLPIIKWLKNGKPVPWSQTVRNLTGEGIGQVIIENIQKSDAGTYTCSAKNSSNEVITESVIRVIPKSLLPAETSTPTFTRVLGEFYRICEDDLILDAHVRGVPEPTIKWYKDGIEINEAMDDRFTLEREGDGGYKFRIHRPNKGDSGEYICEAINTAGKAKISHKVNFQENMKHTHPQFVYHKESFMKAQKIAIEKEETPAPQDGAEGQKSGGDAPTAPTEMNGGSQSNGDSGSMGGAGGSSGGDGNEEGDDNNYKPTTPAAAADDEEEEEEEKKEKFKPRTPRRRPYDGPAPKEPFIIRHSVQKLKFEVKMRDMTSIAGKTVKLKFIVAGPNPKMRWFKNNKPIEWTQTVKNESKEGAGLGNVVIEKATPRDSGIYKCVIRNEYSEIETEARVTIYPDEGVRVKPTFTRITDYYKMEVDDLIVEVQVRGVPTPKIIWKRDGVELEIEENPDKFFVMREPDGVYKLCIHDPQKTDSGRFIVEAVNSAGKEEIRHVIRFLGKDYYRYLPGIRHADKKPEHEAEEGSLTEVVAEEPAAPVEDEEEVLMDKWGNVIPKKEKKLRLREKVLQEMKPKNEEVYIENASLKEIRNRLTFESELKNTVATAFTKAKLLCSISGPNPTIEWFKNDEPLEFNPPRLKNTTSLGFGSITFLSVSPEDAGTYKCVAHNAICRVESSCELTVLSNSDPSWVKPTFTRNLKEYYDQKVNDLILEVHVRGYPKPQLTWSKDGLDIEYGDDKYFTTRHSDGVYRLNIHNPQIRDSGRYGCSAVNVAGSEDLKYYLKVKQIDDYIHTAGLYHADPTQFAKYKEEEERKRQERLNYRPPPRPKPEEPKPVEKPVEPEEEEEAEEEEEEFPEYDSDGEVVVKEKPMKEKKPKKEPTPPPKEATPPHKEPTPPPKEPTPIPEDGVEKKKRNWAGDLETTGEVVPEVAKTPPKSKYHLEFLTKLENRTAVDGASVKLYCQISGFRPEFEWYHNGELLDKESNGKDKGTETSAALLFQNATIEDSGEYRLVVKNRECRIEATCQLNVIETIKPKEEGEVPHFPFGIKHTYNSQIDDLIIEVPIRGTPRLLYKWYKDCREIKNDDKYLQTRDGEIHKLHVHKPTIRDNGTYLIVVENDYGMEHLVYEIEFKKEDEQAHVHGFIHHADLTKTKKYQEEKERKRQEILAYVMSLPKPEPPKPEEEIKPEEEKKEEPAEEVEEEEVEDEEEEEETELNSDGEEVVKPKKEKKPKKEATPPPPPKEPTPPPKEPTPPPKEPTPVPEVPEEPKVMKKRRNWARGLEPETEFRRDSLIPTPPPEEEKPEPEVKSDEIEKPLHVFRAHKIREFRKNADVPLEIVKRLLSQLVKKDSTLKLSCCVSEGERRMQVHWYKDGEPLEIVPGTNANSTEDGLVTLEIKNVDFEHAGRYKCVIKMKKGEVTSECDIKVYGDVEANVEDVPPTLVTTIIDYYRSTLKDIVIEVRMRGKPKPVITWIRDGLPIDPWVQYEKYQIKHDDVNDIHTEKLIINNPNQYRDCGKYIIRAQNRVKTVEFIHVLEFEPKKFPQKAPRMDEVDVVNERPRVNPKPKSPTPPPVEEKPEEKPEEVEEEAEEEPEEEEEKEDSDED